MNRKFVSCINFISFILLLFSNTYSQSSSRMDWYKNSVFFINIDTYPRDFEAAKSPDYKNSIRDLIKRTKVSMIYYHACSQDGYTKYQSKAGIVNPRLNGLDMIRIWRDVTKETGVKFFAYFNYHDSQAEIVAHPEFRKLDKNGNPVPHPCSNSPYPDTYLLPKVRELVSEYDVDGFWIDSSIWAVGPCYCPYCVEGFRKQYGQDPPKERSDRMWQAFAEFERESFEKQSKRLADLAHQLKPSCIYVPNYGFTTYQPEKVRGYADAISGDIGHNRRTQMVSFISRFNDTQGVPWDIMVGEEYWATLNIMPNGNSQILAPFSRNLDGKVFTIGIPKSIDYLNQENAVVRANGGIGCVFVHTLSNSALSPYRNDLLVQMADFIRARLDVFQDTEPLRDVGILHSASTFYNEGTGFCMLQPALNRIEGAHIALLQNNCHVNIFADYDLNTRLNDYRIVILSQQNSLTLETIEAIRNYVKKGGKIVAAGKVAMDPNSPDAPRSLLEDVLGIRFLNEKSLESAYIPWKKFPIQVFCEWYPVETTTAKKVHPMLRDGDELNQIELPYPAITVNQYGEGTAVYIAGDIFTGYFYNQFYGVRYIIEKAMVLADDNKLIETDAPIAVEFAVRKKNNDLIVHMVNKLVDWDTEHEGAVYPENIPPVGPFRLKVRCEKKPAGVLLKPDNAALDWN